MISLFVNVVNVVPSWTACIHYNIIYPHSVLHDLRGLVSSPNGVANRAAGVANFAEKSG